MGNSCVSDSGSPPLLGQAHDPTFVWKIHNFNQLRRRGVMSVCSAPFYCTGFTWFLGVAPRIKKAGSFRSYVSLSLGTRRDSVNMEPGYKLVAVFELSIYNHSNGMYHGYRASSSFDVMHPNSEFECLIPLSKLLKSSDFMDADCCVFGVKILQIDVFSPERKAITKDTTVQNLFIQKNRFIKQTYTTIIKDFPQLNSKDRICSPTFELGGHKWYLGIYPRGEQCSTGWLSVYLYRDAVDDDHPCKSGPAVELALSVVDQKFGVDHIRRSLGLVVFPSDHLHRWGFSKFCLLSIIMDRSRGYLMESSCAIEVGITVVGLSN
ncbi:uncharacterized protein LOC123399016 [Hordeum vulgare subsp. vulgare]|uniref:MATH domain-containing protein n=1 Tax=Hordeum vulgare subsp. vulgare TaxID=112509 RepID=A0A8I7BF28_HORVV|nr:uncharacterized protein LOC123399016 [Hordeum vulgare subsp. vulgare]